MTPSTSIAAQLKETEVRLAVPLTKEQVLDVLTTWLEDTHSPWYRGIREIEIPEDDATQDALLDSYRHAPQAVLLPQCYVVLDILNERGEHPTTFVLNRGLFMGGLTKLAEQYPGLFTTILTNEYDAYTTDLLGQLVVYGKIIWE